MLLLATLPLATLPMLTHPAAATSQLPTDREPLRFYIENVAVEGVQRASPDTIVSESLLEAGFAYTEAELRQAVYRVNRLPFVLNATFSLQRGSQRGKFSLLITVEEVRGFFFGSNLAYGVRGDALTRASFNDELTSSLTAGTRVFAGQGVFFAAVGNGENLQVGYERHQLRDRPILLRLAYARQGCCSAGLQELGLDPAAAVWTATDESDRLELTIGVPLSGNHSLRLDASHLETGSAVRRPLAGDDVASTLRQDVSLVPLQEDVIDVHIDVHDVEQRELELAWVYDSTDDPVFPSRGDALTAAVGLRLLEGDLSEPGAPGSFSEMTSRLIGLSIFGARHWPLSARQTASLSLKVLASRSEIEGLPLVPAASARPLELAADALPASEGEPAAPPVWSGDVDALEVGLGARYAMDLWGPAKIRRLGTLRWETVAELIYADSSPVLSPSAHPLWGMSLSTGIALRNTWGIFRIGFTYLEFDGEL